MVLPDVVVVCSDAYAKELEMSNIPFAESVSSDPVERAIARKVNRILHDPALGPLGREAMVRKVQKELLAHRQYVAQRQALARQVAAVPLPAGAQVVSVQARDGRLLLGMHTAQQSFVWMDAGEVPAEHGLHRAVAPLPSVAETVPRKARKSLEQAIAERRKALGYAVRVPS